MKTDARNNHYGAIFFIGFVIDRVTKYASLHGLLDSMGSIFVRPVLNYGIAFGLCNHVGAYHYMAINSSIFIIYLVLGYYVYDRYAKHHWILGEICVLTGGLCNIVDRFLYAGVVDFISFSYGQWQFPIFNVADILVVVGACSMVIALWQEQ